MYRYKKVNPKLSLVIPHFEGLEGVEEALNLCVNSMVDQVDEIIIERNKGIGYAAAVNRGVAKATGTDIIIANNDTHLISGKLNDLLGSINTVTVPNIVPEPRDNLPRSFFRISREIYLAMIRIHGYFFDERFGKGYFEDDDLIERLKDYGIAFVYQPNVTVHHLNGGGLTMKQVGEQKWFDINKKIFEDKWSVYIK
jgi:hypothetical protein